MRLARNFLVYGLVGVVVTAIKLLFLFVLRDVAHLQEYASVGIAYLIAVIVHFLANKHITFAIRDPRVINAMTVRYFLSLVLAFLIYMANLFALNRMMGLPFYMAVIIALGISYVVNFLIYDKLVFQR